MFTARPASHILAFIYFGYMGLMAGTLGQRYSQTGEEDPAPAFISLGLAAVALLGLGGRWRWARIYCSLVLAVHPLWIFGLLGWAMVRSGGVGAATPGYVLALCVFLGLLLLLAYRLGFGEPSRKAFR